MSIMQSSVYMQMRRYPSPSIKIVSPNCKGIKELTFCYFDRSLSDTPTKNLQISNDR